MAEFLRLQYALERIDIDAVKALLRRGVITEKDYKYIIEGEN